MAESPSTTNEILIVVRMRMSRKTALARIVLGSVLMIALWPVPRLRAAAAGGSWRRLTHIETFGASTALLLTDGTVMVHQIASRHWWKLTPDTSGNYLDGTWSPLADMPAGYAPLYYASAVLPDGRVIVMGGEYLCLPGCTPVWTTLGAIYDPKTDTWQAMAPPAGWTSIGDAQSVVLNDGTFMLADCCTKKQALLDATTLTWTNLQGTGKDDINDEEGWNLLPNGKVLTVDTRAGGSAPMGAQVYNPSTDTWETAGTTTAVLVDVGSRELGPGVLRPDGTLIYTGGTPHNSVYHYSTNSWSAAPDFPGGNDIADGPASLLRNGNVLAFASPGIFKSPVHTFEWDGLGWTAVAAPPHAPSSTSFVWRTLLLPNGQVLATDGSNDVELYTPFDNTYDPAWAPTITSAPTYLKPGNTYTLSGLQLNGLSQANAYGDDAQAATNYPLVRITSQGTGHVFFAATHDHSSMGVATGSAVVSTSFDVPDTATAEPGACDLVVVANGIPSQIHKATICLPSEIGSPSASPSVLWPPNHKFVEVTIDYDLSSSTCPTDCTLTVASNEGDADTESRVVDARHVLLAAERDGEGSGRRYIITITCKNPVGDVTTAQVTVVVPHDRGH